MSSKLPVRRMFASVQPTLSSRFAVSSQLATNRTRSNYLISAPTARFAARRYFGDDCRFCCNGKIDSFVDKTFSFFDDNKDGVINYWEVEKAYLHKGAGSQVARIFEESGLGGKGVTWEMLEYMDLIKAVKDGKVQMVAGSDGQASGTISREEFKKWAEDLVNFHDKNSTDELPGHQDHHE